MREVLFKFIQSEHFKRIIRLTFIHRLAIPFWVKDIEGQTLYKVSQDRSWCRIAKESQRCKEMCLKEEEALKRTVEERKRAFIKSCHIGLLQFCIPLMIEERLFGSLGGCEVVKEDYKGDGVEEWGVDKERFFEAIKGAERVQESLLLAEIELIFSFTSTSFENIKETLYREALNIFYHHCNLPSLSTYTFQEASSKFLEALEKTFDVKELALIKCEEEGRVLAKRGSFFDYSIPSSLNTPSLVDDTIYIPIHIHGEIWGGLALKKKGADKDFIFALHPHIQKVAEAIILMDVASSVRVQRDVLEQKIKDLKLQEEKAYSLCKETEKLVQAIDFDKVEEKTVEVLKDCVKKLTSQEAELLNYIKDLEFHARQLEEWAKKLEKEKEKALFYRKEAERLWKKVEELKAQLKRMEEEAEKVRQILEKAESMKQLRERTKELSQLLSFIRECEEINEPYQLLRFATKRIKDVFNAHIVSYLILEEKGFRGEFSSISPISEACKHSIKTHSKEILSALTKKLTKIPQTHLEGVKSIIFSPIFYERTIMGIISVASFNERAFTIEEERLLSMFCAHLSIAYERAKKFAALKEEAETDQLTGLYNLRYFERYLSFCFQEASTKKTPLSLILIDFDNLKKFNDTFGHQYGNALLKMFAKILQKNARKKDCVARYGGDEFVFVLPLTDTHSAYKVAERIKQEIEKEPFSLKGKKCKITASFGIATYPSCFCKDSQSLIALADQALYAAKNAGRNQIYVYGMKEER